MAAVRTAVPVRPLRSSDAPLLNVPNARVGLLRSRLRKLGTHYHPTLDPAVLWHHQTTPQDPSVQTVLTWCHHRLCIFGLYGAIQMLLLLLLLLVRNIAVACTAEDVIMWLSLVQWCENAFLYSAGKKQSSVFTRRGWKSTGVMFHQPVSRHFTRRQLPVSFSLKCPDRIFVFIRISIFHMRLYVFNRQWCGYYEIIVFTHF